MGRAGHADAIVAALRRGCRLSPRPRNEHADWIRPARRFRPLSPGGLIGEGVYKETQDRPLARQNLVLLRVQRKPRRPNDIREGLKASRTDEDPSQLQSLQPNSYAH